MFLTKLHLDYIDGRQWRLTSPLVYDRRGKYTLIVEPGFITDFASVGWFMRRVFPSAGNGAHGSYGPASVIHDLCYRAKPRLMSRKEADDTFYDAMVDSNVSWWRRWAMWTAVRLFGWHAYNSYGE